MKKVTVAFNDDSLANLTVQVDGTAALSAASHFMAGYPVVQLDVGSSGALYLNTKAIAGFSVAEVPDDSEN